jgi:hypothetical protein
MVKSGFVPMLSGILFLFFQTGCGKLEKEIDLDLPAYQSQYAVECYLEPGQHFSLLLTRSAPYFEPFPSIAEDFVRNIFVEGANVVITHKGVDYQLKNQLILNPVSRKIFNYFNPQFVPYDTVNDFTLKITTADGKIITSKTRILPVIPIDSLVVQFSEKQDTLARALTYLSDPVNQNNYYRRMFHHHSLDSIPDQDFMALDDFLDNSKLVFGTGYDFKAGDTIISTIFHVTREYYDFWESTSNAISANGNPFGQPGKISSNLKGDASAIGIFTGLSYDRVTTIIKK